ncbi:hypothetical protein ACSSS7_000676 [Eimeria intestinalis]
MPWVFFRGKDLLRLRGSAEGAHAVESRGAHFRVIARVISQEHQAKLWLCAMLTSTAVDSSIGGAGIHEERDAFEPGTRLSDADISLAYNDHTYNHEFAGASLAANGEAPVPAAASLARQTKPQGGRAKLLGAAAPVLVNLSVLAALKVSASSRMSTAYQRRTGGEHELPDVVHDEAAAKAEDDKTAALDDLESLLDLLNNSL